MAQTRHYDAAIIGRNDPEQEAKAWLNRLSEVERQRSRAQDMPKSGL